jgi:hypothetical protein
LFVVWLYGFLARYPAVLALKILLISSHRPPVLLVAHITHLIPSGF